MVQKLNLFIIGILVVTFGSSAFAKNGVCAGPLIGILGITASIRSIALNDSKIKRVEKLMKKSFERNRMGKLIFMLKSLQNNVGMARIFNIGFSSVAGFTAMLCGMSVARADATEIVKNPADSLRSNEDFRNLAAQIGTDKAVDVMKKISNGESTEELMKFVTQVVEKKNQSESHFLDESREKAVEVSQ